MKIFKLIILSFLLSFFLFSCTSEEENNTKPEEEEIVLDEPDKYPIPFAVGTWAFVKMHGLNDDGSSYDINQKIAEYEKLLRQGGLIKEISDDIIYVLPRLKTALTSFPFKKFIIEEGGLGRVRYTNDAWGPYELTWTEENESTFHIDYGGGYHLNYYFRLDSNLKTGYYLARDWDPDGPNVKIYVNKK